MNRPFTIVDVFAERKYAGNPLAVIENASGLSREEMQSIARETNFSETTFVMDDKPTVKIFTPREEIPFAGHPTLGTAAVLMGEKSQMTIHVPAGAIPVTRKGDLFWMKQNPPMFGAKQDGAEMTAMIGVPTEGGQDVSTGLFHTVVRVESLDALKRVRIDLPRYWKWTEGSQSKSIAVFAREGDVVAMRVFPIYYGISEDPATGSAAGCLAAVLAREGPVDLRIHQGAEVGRPSLLYLRAVGSDIRVGGKVQRIVEGKLAASLK